MKQIFTTTAATVICPVCLSENIEHLAVDELEYRCLDCHATFDATDDRVVVERDR